MSMQAAYDSTRVTSAAQISSTRNVNESLSVVEWRDGLTDHDSYACVTVDQGDLSEFIPTAAIVVAQGRSQYGVALAEKLRCDTAVRDLFRKFGYYDDTVESSVSCIGPSFGAGIVKLTYMAKPEIFALQSEANGAVFPCDGGMPAALAVVVPHSGERFLLELTELPVVREHFGLREGISDELRERATAKFVEDLQLLRETHDKLVDRIVTGDELGIAANALDFSALRDAQLKLDQHLVRHAYLLAGRRPVDGEVVRPQMSGVPSRPR